MKVMSDDSIKLLNFKIALIESKEHFSVKNMIVIDKKNYCISLGRIQIKFRSLIFLIYCEECVLELVVY